MHMEMCTMDEWVGIVYSIEFAGAKHTQKREICLGPCLASGYLAVSVGLLKQ